MGTQLPSCVSNAYLALRTAERIDYKGIDAVFNSYQFEGIVNVITVSPFGRLYFGGDFTLTQNNSTTVIRRNAAAFSSKGVLQSWNPSPNGSVNAIAVSSLGEIIYIGGLFNTVLNEASVIIDRVNVASLSATGQINDWNPSPSGRVNAIATLDEFIYIGGEFTIDNQSPVRNNVAAFNTQGQIQGWNPSPNGVVNAIAVLGENIYIGGKFSLVNQENVGTIKLLRSNIASFDKNGVLLFWFPNPNGDVNTIAASDNIIYIGGAFNIVGDNLHVSGISRNNSAAFDTSGNVINHWNPSPNGTINTISILNGNIYIGGRFSEVGTNDTRINVAAYDDSGELQNWNPSPRNISDNLSVIKSIVASGNSVYVGGDFETIDNNSKTTVAKVSDVSGNLIGLPGTSPIFDNYQIEGVINDISVARNGKIYIGGNFELTENNDDTVIRINTAAFNTDGTLLSWNPTPNGPIYAVTVSESTIYIGGEFTTINNQSRFNIAAINADGTLLEWNPSPRNSNNDNPSHVNAISVLNSIIYIGGLFNRVTNETGQFSTRNNAVAFSDKSVLQIWNPSPNNEVYAIAILNELIYIGGFFSIVNENNVAHESPTENRQSAAAFNTTGVLQPWNPTPHGPVYAIGALGETIYLGGQFDSVTTTIISRKNAAAFDISGDLIQTWNPSPNGIVNAIAVSGLYIYIGGEFDKVKTTYTEEATQVERIYAASFSIDGELQSWEPLIDGPVKAIAISSFNVYIGGFFYNVPDYSPQIAINEVNPITGALINITSSQIQTPDLFDENTITGTVRTVVVSPTGTIYVGGLFVITNNGDTIRTNIASFSDTGIIQPWNSHTNGIVYAIALLGENVYIGGEFTRVIRNNNTNTAERNNAAAFTAFGELLPWNPSPFHATLSPNINALAILGETIYIGGRFSTVNKNNGSETDSRFNAAAFTAAGILLDWNPSPFNNSNDVVLTIATYDEIIYIGGTFEKVNRFNGPSIRNDRKNIASFNALGELQTWNPSFTNTNSNARVNVITIYDETIYIGGLFSTVTIDSTNAGRTNAAAFDISSGSIKQWKPNPNNSSNNSVVNDIAIFRDYIYISGFFDTVNTNNGSDDDNNETIGTRHNIAAFNTAGEIQAWTPPKTNKVNVIAFSDLNIYVGLDDPVSKFTSGSIIKLPTPLEINNAEILLSSVFNRYQFSTTDSSGVNAITSLNGNIYIGGNFNLTNDRNKVIRKNAAAFNFNGELLEWNPSPNGVVHAIIVLGSNIYIGGQFTSVNRNNTVLEGTDTRINAAAFTSDGVLLNWNPSPNGPVYALNVLGSIIYIGGKFTIVNNDASSSPVNISRNNAAAFNKAGEIQEWNPSPVDSHTPTAALVYAIAVLEQNIYIGGIFKTVNKNNGLKVNDLETISRVNAAKFSSNGMIQNWNPQPANNSDNAFVRAIAVFDSNIYIGGSFSNVKDSELETARSNIALFSSAGNGTLQSWNPSPNGVVNTITIFDDKIYIGGVFSNVNTNNNNSDTSQRTNAAAFTTTGEVQSWNPKVNGDVNVITGSGTNIYIGGLFSNLNEGSVPKNVVAEVESISGKLIGLLQSQIAFKNYRFLNTLSSAPPVVFTIKVSSDNTLYVGGHFNLSDVRHISKILRSNAAAFSENGSLLPWNPAPDGIVKTIVEADSIIYIGGNFSSVNELNGTGGMVRINRPNIAAFNTSGQIVSDWNPSPNGVVNAIAVLNNTVYFGGVFTTVKSNGTNVNRGNIAAFSIGGDLIVNWNPVVGSSVLAVATLDNIIYIGGDDGDPAKRAVAFDASGVSVSTWSPTPNNRVESIATHAGVIFIGGLFGTVRSAGFGDDGFDVFQVAAYKPNGELFGWNPAPSTAWIGAQGVYAISIYPTPNNSNLLQIYIGGKFNQLRNAGNPYIVFGAGNAATIGFLLPSGEATSGIVLQPVRPTTNNTIYTIAFSDGLTEQRVYYGGEFITMNSKSIIAAGTTDLSGNLL